MKLLSSGMALMATLGAISATSAEAGVESAYYGQLPPYLPGECQQTQDRGDANWRPAQGRLVIIGQGTVAIEFFGHFFDMIKTADVAGTTGVEARVYKGYNGTFNNIDRHCGGIGSVVVTLTIDQRDGPTNGVLHLDNERIPITFKPLTAGMTTWEDAFPRSSASGSAPANAPAGTVSRPITLEQPANCDPTTCGGGGTQSMVVSRDVPGGSIGTQRSTNLLGCAAPHGLVVTNANTGNMTLTLPQIRSAGLGTCFSERRVEFKVDYAPLAPGEHFAAGGLFNNSSPTRVNVSANGGLPLRSNTDLQPVGTEGGVEIYGFNIDPGFVNTFVGRKTYAINPEPGGNLTLQLVSSPEYGVKNLAGPVYAQNLGRLNSTVNVRLTPHNATAANQPFAWLLTASGIAPETCFGQISGTVTPPAGETNVVIALTATEREGCAGKSFTVRAWPSSLTSSGQDTPFEKQVTFVLQARQKTFAADTTPTPNVPESVGAGIRRQ